MSGGVDSTVVAALLKDAGYDVIGVTLQLYDHGAAVQKKGACCAGPGCPRRAGRAAEQMGIPHYVLDYESRFRQSVIDDFADSYLRGETPVPCIRCNQTVASSATCLDTSLATWGRSHGHRSLCAPRKKAGDGDPSCAAPSILRGIRAISCSPPRRDQLEFPALFPLGALPKSAVRQAAAAARRLAVAEKA